MEREAFDGRRGQTWREVRSAQPALDLAATVDIRGVSNQVTAEIAEEVWSSHDEPGFHDALDRSVCANIDALFEIIQGRRRCDEPAPMAALDFADTTAQIGVPAIELERAYRVGLSSLWAQWLDLAVEHADSTGLRLDALIRGPSLVFLTYVDSVLLNVVERADEVRAELRRTQSELRRLQLLRVVDGSSSASEAELDSLFDYHVGDVHLALLLQSSDARTLHRDVAALRQAADARGALILQHSPRSWFVWLGSARGFSSEQLTRLRRSLARTELTVAVGEPGGGLQGLRDSYQQAFDTARLQQALGPAGSSCLWASDVRLESLLLRDGDRARQFVKAELGRLADGDAVAERLRETLLTWLATGSHVSAAALLGVHKNTVRNRLSQAEELLGCGLQQRQIELQVALRLERVLRADREPRGELQGANSQLPAAPAADPHRSG